MPEQFFDFLKCPPPQGPYYFVRSRCGNDRDCLNDDRFNPYFPGIYCNALAWCENGQGRYVEIYTADKSTLLYKVTEAEAPKGSADACHRKLFNQPPPRGSKAPPAGFTVQIPGITDFIKLPGLESPELRKQRAARARASNSALPNVLKWIPPLLNKLDDAQDLLFTGIALAWPLLRWIGKPLLGPLGWLLLANDILNLFT